MNIAAHFQLLSSGLSTFLFYYAYDTPASLNSSIIIGGEALDAERLSFLYSAYAFPNILAPILFYYKKSVKSSGLRFSSLVLVGQAIFLLGVYSNLFLVMVIGRFFIGLGLETYVVIQNQIIAEIFDRNLVYLNLFSSFSRSGTVCCFLLSKGIEESVGFRASLAFSTFVVFIGFLVCLGNHYFQNKVNGSRNLNIETESENSAETVFDINEAEKTDYSNITNSGDKSVALFKIHYKNENSVWKNDEELFDLKPFDQKDKKPAIDNLNSVNKFKNQKTDKNCEKNILKESENLKKSYKGFKPAFFFIVLFCLFFSSVWAPFYNVATLMFQKRFGATPRRASNLLAITEFTALIFYFILGLISKKTGKKLDFIFAGCCLLTMSHLLFLYKKMSLEFICFCLGLSGPMVNFYWPSTVFVVDSENLGRGFAILSCISNLSYTVAPIIAGKLIIYGGYYYVEKFILSICIIAFSILLVTIYMNKKFSLNLNKK